MRPSQEDNMEGVAFLSPRVFVPGIWLLALYFLIICFPVAMAQTGFVSLDCGAIGSSYNESDIIWTPDNGFGLSGVSNETSVTEPNFKPPAQFYTIRYFPGDQTKYCYEFNEIDHGIQQYSAYLIRASFWAGDSVPFRTRVGQQIDFKLLINSNEWDDVSVELPQSTAVVKEIYVVADSRPSIAVCLAGRGIGLDIPFISSLVLRPLGANMVPVLMMKKDQAASRAMFTLYRVNYGAPSNYIVRYPDDRFDRVWDPDTTQPSIGSMSTSQSVDTTNLPEHPPLQVMQTAYQNDEYFSINMSVASGYSYFFELYFTEISENVTAAGQRVFELDVLNGTGDLFASSTIDLYSLGYLHSHEVSPKYPVFVQAGGDLNFSFQKLTNSIYGPLICGLELLRISDNDMSLGSDEQDVVALNRVTTTFMSLNSWNGDPCLPYAYNWINCTNDQRPHISILSLSNKKLEGEIPTAINDLTKLVKVSLAQNTLSGSIPDLSALRNLQFLDLHDNNLNGSIPEFLAELPSLTTLLLQNNNFSGDVPSALLEKVSASNLNLSIAGNPLLCCSIARNPLLCSSTNQSYCPQGQTSSSKNRTPLVVGLEVTGAFVALVAFGVLVLCIIKRNSHSTNSCSNIRGEEENLGRTVPPINIAARANPTQCFTYEDIKTITNNFNTSLGRGGFGHVYHGVLPNGVNVAIKVLSEDSRQGVEEFLNEVDLLSRTHHKNLVELLGYCTEVTLMLVYEFMSNGSLYHVLHGRAAKLITWRDRLKIAIASAEGLDYLHRGCNPPIVHRDVKSSNILLNERKEAKVSDFGISRSKDSTMGGASKMFTTVQGSFGYLDPEYVATNIATHKIDVYAFGVVLFEIISGRRPFIHQLPSGQQWHIIEWVKPLVERGNINEILDPSLGKAYNFSSIWKVIDIALMCVLRDSNKRPSMSEVSINLRSALSMELNSDETSSSNNSSLAYTTEVCAR